MELTFRQLERLPARADRAPRAIYGFLRATVLAIPQKLHWLCHKNKLQPNYQKSNPPVLRVVATAGIEPATSAL